MRAAPPRLRRVLALAIGGLPLLAGCGLQRQPALMLAPSSAALSGLITRGGAPLPGQLVKLYDDTETVLFDSLRTDPAGHYGFDRAPAGGLMVKASSVDPLDFSYVRYIFTRGSSTERDSIPPMDLRTHGCAPGSPASGASVPAPNPGAPLVFSWSPVSGGSGLRYKVRLADAADSTVWEPATSAATTSTFNGIGDHGAYAGQLVPAGAYNWRVKVHFPSGLTAATVSRPITFTGAAP